MKTGTNAKILRIFISDTDKFKHGALYEMIVFSAKHYGLAGATVTRGVMGFGASSVVRSFKFWEVTEKLPVVVEIVDDSEKILKFIEKIKPWFEKLRYGCLITVEDASVVLYRKGSKKSFFSL